MVRIELLRSDMLTRADGAAALGLKLLVTCCAIQGMPPVPAGHANAKLLSMIRLADI